ncbi:MAG: RidA family protein [Actinobacteria bacterium]|nr:RidA family protein [Actinomycetota bacterium]
MSSEPISTPHAAGAVGAYSQGWRAGDFIFVTGTTPIGPSGEIETADVGAQTRAAIANVEAVLHAADADLSAIVKVMAYLSDSSDFEQFNRAYAECIPEPRPVRTTIGVDMGQILGMKVELDVIAYVEPKAPLTDPSAKP